MFLTIDSQLASATFQRRKWRTPLLASVLCILCSPNSSYCVEVKGKIWAAVSLTPPSEGLAATVELAEIGGSGHHVTQSGPAGGFEFRNVGPGIYRASASAPGFLTAMIFPIVVADAGLVTPSFSTMVLTRGEGRRGESLAATAIVVGVVVHAMKLVESSRICFIDDRKIERCATTNSLGMYQIALSNGRFLARIHFGTTLRHEERVSVYGGQGNVLNFVLSDEGKPFLNPRLVGPE